MSNLLSHINSPKDLRELSTAELETVANELREFIIEIVATKEGHLGASLGVVELTIALHYVFQTPEDLLIWDVGHQAYGHKILTGRRDIFDTNRQLGGISGFPKRSESEYDTFGVGHSSTSISAALGMAIASKIQDEEIVVMDSLAIDEPKTREIAGMLKSVGLQGVSTLIATESIDQNVYKSARNIAGVSVSPVSDLNALSVLQPHRMLITKSALDALKTAGAE